MRSVVRKLLVVGGILFGGLFVMFVFNQTVQFVAVAERVSPLLGTIVLWGLLALYAGGVVLLFWNFMRLPKPLRAPATDDSPEFEAFLTRLRARLRSNTALHAHLRDHSLDTRADVETALAVLGQESDELTRTTALQAFFVTALGSKCAVEAVGRGVRTAAEKTATTAGETVRGFGRAFDSVRTTVRELAAGRPKGD